MAVIGLGTDIVSIKRMAQVQRKHEKVLSRILTPYEQSWVNARTDRLSGCFAAKEAALKAMGTGLSAGISWQDMEVRHTSQGAPEIHFYKRAEERLALLGVNHVFVSISHEREFAVATVILEA